MLYGVGNGAGNEGIALLAVCLHLVVLATIELSILVL